MTGTARHSPCRLRWVCPGVREHPGRGRTPWRSDMAQRNLVDSTGHGRKHKRRQNATAAEWAWAAGIFEGEGTFAPMPNRVRMTVKMTDEDTVRRFAAIVGGVVYGPYKYDQPDGHIRKPAWVWNSDGVDVREIARRFEPWLGQRRRARLAGLGLLDQGTLL